MNYLDEKYQLHFKRTWVGFSDKDNGNAKHNLSGVNYWLDQLPFGYKVQKVFNSYSNSYNIYGHIVANNGYEVAFTFGYAQDVMTNDFLHCILFWTLGIENENYGIILPITHLNEYQPFNKIPISIQLIVGKNSSW